MSRYMLKSALALFLALGHCVYAQNLTVSTSGQTGTSGTNWSISGNTLTVTGTANIQASVIENHLTNTGPLTIVGNTTPSNLQVSVNEAINVSSGNNSLVIGASDNKGGITTTQTITLSGSISFHGGWVRLENNVETTGSGAKILAKANEPVSPFNATDGFISFSSGKNLTTNGGDIILWANATNKASGQANNEIILLGTNTLSTSGGKIVMAGGLDNGSNGGTASDGIPDGYAYRGSYGGRPIDIKASVTLNSGGGEIIIRGEQNGSDAAVGADATFTISNGGAVTIEGKNTTATSVALGTANIESTATNAPVSISGTTHITNSGLTTITTQGGDVLLASNVDDATDGEAAINGQIRMGSGLSITTNGGDITLGGGNTDGSDYAIGQTTGNIPEGIRIDGSVNLNSGNGNIALRGKSAAVALANNVGGGAIMFYNVINGSINSGTGTLLLDGYSQTTGGNAIAGLLWWNAPTASTFTIQSANTTTSAITLNGYSTSSTGQSYGLEVEATNTLNVYATGTGGGININGGRSQSNTDPNENLDIVFRGPVNILADSGPISIKGGQLGGVSNGYWFTTLQTQIGSAAVGVTSSASDITIAFDRFWFDANYFPKLATTGTVTIEPLSTGFGMGVSSAWFQYNQNGQTMTGLTLGKAGNTADINHEITAITAAGPISVYGGNIGINENLNTSAGAADGDVLLKASGNNNLANGKSITTSGGDVTFWSDSDGNGTGYAQVGSSTAITTAGGNITLGGGADIATGYARGAAERDAVTEPTFDLYVSGVHLKNGASLSSGGGNITLRGQNVGNGDDYIQFGIMGHNATVNAGSGKVSLDGIAGGSSNNNAQAISSYGNGWTILSANTDADAIVLNGDASAYNGTNTSLGVNFSGTIESIGGGGMLISGKSGTASSVDVPVSISGSVLGDAGAITITGENNVSTETGINIAGALTIGYKASTNVTSSSANIILKSDNTVFNSATNLNTTGAVSLLPLDASPSFGVAQTIGSNMVLSSGVSGLTIGKSGNTADINIMQAQTIAGPISVYGGNIGINENLNTSAGAADGDVLLKASGNNNLANGKSITTSGGDVTFWSDSDGNGTGYAQVGSSTAITTAGGNITLGGGADIATGYARGAAESDGETDPVFTLYISGVHLKNGTSLSSGGGNITLRGQNYDTNGGLSFGVMGHNATLDAGSGKVALIGKATGSGISNSQAISVYNGWTIRSSNPDADAIVLDGDGSGYNGTVTTMGINFAGIIESTGGGGIQLTGKSGTSTSYDHPLDIYGSILANSGTITITAENNDATQFGLYLSGATFGFKAATNVTASTSNIILKSDNTVFNSTTNLNTTGAVSLLPLDASSSFGVAQTIGSNMVLSSGVSGLTIGKSGNTANVTISNAIDIAGPISVYGGDIAVNENLSSSTGSTISLYGNTLNFASGKTVTSNNGQLIVAPQNPALTIGMAGASGNLSLPASYFSDNFTDGFSNVQIGSANQTGGISTNDFNLQDNMTLLTSGTLTLGGKPVLGANNMTLGEDITTIDVGVAQNYFKSDSTGRLKRQISDGNSRLLPIGRAYYNPVTITNNSGTTDVFSAGVLDSVFLNGFVGPLIETPHVKVTWDLDKENANGGNGIQAEFGWFASQEEGLMSSYRLNHHNGTNWGFASGTSNAVSGTSFKTMEHINYIGSFSPFAISEDGSVLPVEFLGMQYDCLGQQGVSLTWQTASELNAQHFEVMCSENGFTWEQIGTVAATGTSNQLTEYQFLDESPVRAALRYYQLKQEDFDGQFEWLPIISVNCEASGGIRLYPNPAQSKVVLEFTHDAEEMMDLRIYDALGHEVKVEQIAAMIGFNRIEFNVSELSSGAYQLRIGLTKNLKLLNLLINR